MMHFCQNSEPTVRPAIWMWLAMLLTCVARTVSGAEREETHLLSPWWPARLAADEAASGALSAIPVRGRWYARTDYLGWWLGGYDVPATGLDLSSQYENGWRVTLGRELFSYRNVTLEGDFAEFDNGYTNLTHAGLHLRANLYQQEVESASMARLPYLGQFMTPATSRLDLVAGYRYQQLGDWINISSPGTTYRFSGYSDHGTSPWSDYGDIVISTPSYDYDFETTNDFHGGDLGLAWS